MSSIFSLPPILFVPLRDMYGISYTLLGTLVLTNFFTQLTVDLLFSFRPRLFDIPKVVRHAPVLAAVLKPAVVPVFACFVVTDSGDICASCRCPY